MQQTQEIAAQNAALKLEVNTTKQRLDVLEEQLRKQQRTARTPQPTDKPKDDKNEW